MQPEPAQPPPAPQPLDRTLQTRRIQEFSAAVSTKVEAYCKEIPIAPKEVMSGLAIILAGAIKHFNPKASSNVQRHVGRRAVEQALRAFDQTSDPSSN